MSDQNTIEQRNVQANVQQEEKKQDNVQNGELDAQQKNLYIITEPNENNYSSEQINDMEDQTTDLHIVLRQNQVKQDLQEGEMELHINDLSIIIRKEKQDSEQKSGQEIKPQPELKKPRKSRKRIIIEKIQNVVKQSIIGQDEAVDRVILAICRSILIETIKTNVLIIGKSGSGKTETMKQVAKALKLPYTIEDATKYTQEGYVGGDVEEMIYNLIENAGDIELAEKGILIVDEIDKKANANSVYDNMDISGRAVLNSLLKIVEGTTVYLDMGLPMGVQIDTSKMIVIFMGAFDGIEKIREKRLKQKGIIGFNIGKEEKSKESKEKRYIKEDLIEYGLPTEFVGRIDTIIEFETLSEESLARILKESNLSIFKKYKDFLKKKGITLEYPEDIFAKIAKKAISKNTGARELANITNEIFESITYKLFTAKKGQYSKCILHDGFVDSPSTEYELI